MIPDEAVESAVNARGRASNPKWDHPIMGYRSFSEDQKECLRNDTRIALEAAAPHMMAAAWDEGYTTGNAHNGRRDTNPYRKDPLTAALNDAEGHALAQAIHDRKAEG